MDKILNIAVQCDSLFQILALLIITCCIIVINLVVKAVIKMALSTISHYHDVTVKITRGDSVNAELDLHK